MEQAEVVILGAGVTGMSAASVLGDRAVVLERSDRPGGLVKTECYDGYWFDHVLHLLYTDEPDTEVFIRQLLGDDLGACPPVSWVETSHGTVRFPFQFHLGDIGGQKAVDALLELAELTYRPPADRPANFEEMLLRTFGRTMCEIFYFPYNRKAWKRSLKELAPQGFTWNIQPVELRKALSGALTPEKRFAGYNSRGWYPRPPANAKVRGMEVLSRRLAQRVPDLRVGHTVTELDLKEQIVTVECDGGQTYRIHFEKCVSTIPLPKLLGICSQTPMPYRRGAFDLTNNRVLTAAFSIKGPRPENSGHWRYYSSESLSFTRLIYPHQFDPLTAPADGWGLMAEIVEPAELALEPKENIFKRVREDLDRAGAIPPGCEIVDQHMIVVDPAYVVFSLTNQRLVNSIRAFFERRGMVLMGRYGRWSYTSMAQVMGRGLRWAQNYCQTVPPPEVDRTDAGLYAPAPARRVVEEV